MNIKRINLVLQGGGAHGAFTWGVLDRLLEDERLEVAAISGASAGAKNCAALKAGMAAGGRIGAKENLDWFWGRWVLWWMIGLLHGWTRSRRTLQPWQSRWPIRPWQR